MCACRGKRNTRISVLTTTMTTTTMTKVRGTCRNRVTIAIKEQRLNKQMIVKRKGSGFTKNGFRPWIRSSCRRPYGTARGPPQYYYENNRRRAPTADDYVCRYIPVSEKFGYPVRICYRRVRTSEFLLSIFYYFFFFVYNFL